jgi:hypothetical protein
LLLPQVTQKKIGSAFINISGYTKNGRTGPAGLQIIRSRLLYQRKIKPVNTFKGRIRCSLFRLRKPHGYFSGGCIYQPE